MSTSLFRPGGTLPKSQAPTSTVYGAESPLFARRRDSERMEMIAIGLGYFFVLMITAMLAFILCVMGQEL